MKYYKRTDETRFYKLGEKSILAMARLYLQGMTLEEIAQIFNVSNQLVSYHFIHTLKELDYSLWIHVRIRINSTGKHKDKNRVNDEQAEIQNYMLKFNTTGGVQHYE